MFKHVHVDCARHLNCNRDCLKTVARGTQKSKDVDDILKVDTRVVGGFNLRVGVHSRVESLQSFTSKIEVYIVLE